MLETLEKVARLKKMLAQIAPGNTLESIPRPSQQTAGLESMGGERPAVETALQKLAEDRTHDMTDAEMFGLEAIVMKTNRPAVFVRGDSYDDCPHPWEALNPAEVKAGVSSHFPMVGRIEVPNLPQFPYAGTGFVVGKGLL